VPEDHRCARVRRAVPRADGLRRRRRLGELHVAHHACKGRGILERGGRKPGPRRARAGHRAGRGRRDPRYRAGHLGAAGEPAAPRGHRQDAGAPECPSPRRRRTGAGRGGTRRARGGPHVAGARHRQRGCRTALRTCRVATCRYRAEVRTDARRPLLQHRVLLQGSAVALSSRGMRRRDFLQHLGAGSALAFLPSFTRDAFAANAADESLLISEVEVLKLSGTHELVRGLNRQFQVQPLHVYEERRPKPFKDPPQGTKPERLPLTHYYVRIRTRGGAEGLYGLIEKEALPPLLANLRPLVIGQHALAVERLWDQMYRSNRHSRAGHYMMAISAVDNALWDLRGRVFGAPVFRLLGGPTQLPVPVYGSCLGFSIDPPLAAKRAAQLKKDGF